MSTEGRLKACGWGLGLAHSRVSFEAWGYPSPLHLPTLPFKQSKPNYPLYHLYTPLKPQNTPQYPHSTPL